MQSIQQSRDTWTKYEKGRGIADRCIKTMRLGGKYRKDIEKFASKKIPVFCSEKF